MRKQPTEAEVLACPGDKERPLQAPAIEPFEIQISAIHDVKRARFGSEQIENVHIVDLGSGHPHKGRNGAAQVEQGMQFQGVLGAFVARPGKQGHAHIDDGRIQRVHGVGQIQSQFLVNIERPRLPDEDVGEIRIDSPVARFVGIGQGAARDRAANPQVVQPTFLRAQASHDVAQALAEGQLGKGHAEKMVPTGETSHPVVASIALDTLAKLVAGQMLRQLRKQRLSAVHGAAIVTAQANGLLFCSSNRSRDSTCLTCGTPSGPVFSG